MDRIAVVGCGGSGKTWLSQRLAATLSLPVTHLDAEYYDEAWQPMPQEAFAERQRELVAAPRWLLEGNYAGTLAIRLVAADTLVFLDLPAWTCLAGIAQRRWRYRGGQHTDGVYDRITWDFVKYIWGYRASMRPRVRDLIAAHGGHLRVVTLTSRRQATAWLAGARWCGSSGESGRGQDGPRPGAAVRGGQAPEADPLVGSGGGEGLTVGAEVDRVDRSGMAAQL